MAIPKPTSPVESEIFDLFKENDPSGAYINGLKEYVGKIFVPSKRNLEKFSRRVDELRLKVENKSQLKVLDSLAAWYGLAEPHMVPESVLNAYTGDPAGAGVVAFGSITGLIDVPAGSCCVRNPSPLKPRSSEYDHVTWS